MAKISQESEKDIVIDVSGIGREFRSYKKGAGFWESVKGLVNRKYTTKIALREVSFKVRKGEIIGLIGPNGAGKSTLIKILSGVLYPTHGDMSILGYVPWTDRIKYTKHIGVVFGQKSQLWWDLPAVDSFVLNKSLYDIPESVYKRRLRAMVRLLDVGELMKMQVRQMSLGERMRCEIIQSLLHNPPIVFFDEPTIGLDVIAKERMRDFIKEINQKEGTTFIITTHDMDDIEKLCERVIIINHGKIIYDGSLEEVRKRFANKKIIDCKMSEPKIGNFEMKGCKVLEKRPHQIILELDLSKNKLRRVIGELMKRYGLNIEDMAITDPPIEETIKAIYRKK